MKARTPRRRLIGLLSTAVLAFTAAAPAASAVADPLAPSAGTTLTATATATANLTRTYKWTLDKSVSPTTLDLFTGDSGTAQYTVQATRDQGTVASSITGQVCVTNGGAVATESLAITANVTMPPSTDIVATSPVDVTGHPVLQPGDSQCYGYIVPVPSPVTGATYKMTADVTITNHSGHLGTPFGPSPSATAVMPTTETPVHGSLAVSDTNGGSWTFNDSGSQTYEKTFSCNGDQGSNDNTVTSSYTDDNSAGPTASASVTVNCYALGVTKDANTSLTRTYGWTIDKSADQSSLTLALNQLFDVNYKIAVTATPTDSNWAASGNITVHNPAPMAATVTAVTDKVGDTAATVTCPGTAPYTVPAGGDLKCTYALNLPNANGGTNTATATLQNTPSGTTDFTGTAEVSFGNAQVTEVDKTATVSDTFTGPYVGTGPGLPATVNATDSPITFNYTRTVGPYTTPGNYTVDNTATVVAGDSGTKSEDSVSIPVVVPGAGCTLTIGYWKTHAGGVGHNPDMVTALLPIWLGTSGGAKSVQVTTAAQAINLLGYSGDAANGINKLYGQLLAAKLNIANGANGSAVASIISAADAFLATHNSADWTTLTKTQKTQVNSWATSLDNYNNGLTGPGHCSQ